MYQSITTHLFSSVIFIFTTCFNCRGCHQESP